MHSGMNLDNYINDILGSVFKADIAQTLVDYSEKLVDTTLESSSSKEVSG